MNARLSVSERIVTGAPPPTRMDRTQSDFFGEERPEDLTELSVLRLPIHLRERYASVLISNGSDAMDGDDDTLVVTTNWLAWREAVEQGRHWIHVEWGLADGFSAGRDDALYLRYNNWMIVDGTDVTMFHGISLGKLLWREVTLSCLAWERLAWGLKRIIGKFKPDRIVFRTVDSDYDLLDADILSALVAYVGDVCGVQVVDQSGAADAARAMNSPYGRQVEGGYRDIMRAVYGFVVGAVSVLGHGLGGFKPGVFILNNRLVTEPLLMSARSRALAPVVIAEEWPKSLRFVFECWRQGVVLAALPRAPLTSDDENRIVAIFDHLRAAWQTSARGLEAARRQIIERRILTGGLMRERAREAKRYSKLLRRHRIASVMVGDATNGKCRTVLETARSIGLPSSEMPNGVFLCNQHSDARVGDTTVGELLLWGPVAERWSQKAASGLPPMRSGHPALPALRQQPRPAKTELRRWLVLPWYVDADDVRGLRSNIVSTLVETLQVLKARGYHDIRIKLHPGMGDERKFIEQVLAHFGLNVSLFADGPLAPHIKWADGVAGPINSGATIETLAAGRPYYAFRVWPSSVDIDHLVDVPVMSCAADLARALDSGFVPDQEAMLEALCAARSVDDPIARTWDILERNGLRDANGTTRGEQA